MNYFHFKKSRRLAFSSEHVSWRERLSDDAWVGWIIIMSISLLVGIILAAFAIQLFFIIKSGSIKAVDTVVSLENNTGFDQKKLADIISLFKTKSSTTLSIEHGFDGPPDPSQ